MLLIVLGAIVIGGMQEWRLDAGGALLAVLGACLLWAVDNNLTRKIALSDASFIAMTKGLAAGSTNLILAWVTGSSLPDAATAVAAGVVGFLSYGASLVLFVIALRHLGTARTGAYFSTAPFVGAVIALVMLREPITWQLISGGGLMALGVWLHLTERHVHEHRHEAIEHQHEHMHDEHHRHAHTQPVLEQERHSHWHRHEPLDHEHPHYPDAHHWHGH